MYITPEPPHRSNSFCCTFGGGATYGGGGDPSLDSFLPLHVPNAKKLPLCCNLSCIVRMPQLNFASVVLYANRSNLKIATSFAPSDPNAIAKNNRHQGDILSYLKNWVISFSVYAIFCEMNARVRKRAAHE